MQESTEYDIAELTYSQYDNVASTVAEQFGGSKQEYMRMLAMHGEDRFLRYLGMSVVYAKDVAEGLRQELLGDQY